MSGINEILLIIAIILGIFFVPRMFPSRAQKPPMRRIVNRKFSLQLTGAMRLAIFLSLLWPMATAAYIQPWRKDLYLYLYLAFGPVLTGWGLFWVLKGYKKNKGHRKSRF